MSKFIKKQSESAGLVPGTLIHIGDKRTEAVKITVVVGKIGTADTADGCRYGSVF